MKSIRFHWAVALACTAVAAAGCGGEPPLGSATGRVTFRGAPVSEGAIVFTDSAQGAAYVADLEADGKFAFQVARGAGLPPGTYEVTIRPPRPNKPALGYVAPNYKKADYPNIPKKYHEAKTSGLSVTVQSGEQAPFDFDMQ